MHPLDFFACLKATFHYGHVTYLGGANVFALPAYFVAIRIHCFNADQIFKPDMSFLVSHYEIPVCDFWLITIKH